MPPPAQRAADSAAEAARAYVNRLHPGLALPHRVVVEFAADGAVLRVNVELVPSPSPKPEFVPTEFQAEIMEALAGRALRSDGLAKAVGVEKSRLYHDPGGVPELIEEGWVRHHKRVGYYSAQAPPAALGPTET
jgi:hypothetical protein